MRYRNISTQPWLLSCEDCGSTVSDADAHDDFHLRLGRLAEVLDHPIYQVLGDKDGRLDIKRV